ncbi:MAG: DUF4956 domain-containing protein [Lachnospiraceae bacterium]|nr:DUF4956 domain-containing protein [Lachnospiraceae bacterium]
MISEILTTITSSTSSLSVTTACVYGGAALILGLIISLTYMKTGKVSKNFARTLIILPSLVCVVMLAVNGNLGASVAVLGAFSLVRFRSLQGTSREIGFIFFAMTVGILCSVSAVILAAVVTVAICGMHFVLHGVKFAEKVTMDKELRITIPENLDYTDIFDDLFEEYTSSSKLNRVKTTNMGSMYELTYQVALKDETKEKKFLDEIRCRNGNLTVICGRMDYNQLEEL